MDLLILAAIAIFIFVRLIGELGKVDEDSKRDAIRNFVKEQTHENAQNDGPKIAMATVVDGKVKEVKEVKIDEKSAKILENVAENIRSDLVVVLQKVGVTAADFINGANMAFEMVLDAFAKADLETLKMLLVDKIFNQFDLAVKDRKAKNQLLNTKIFMIEKSEITSAKIVDNFAFVTVKFDSKQINYVTDLSGKMVVEGSKEEINNMSDVWTFKKDVNSSNPNWIVSSTGIS